MAALDDAAVMFASKSNHGNPSTVVYRPLASWAPNSDWQVQLDKGEETVAIAVEHKFACIATSSATCASTRTRARSAPHLLPHDLVALAASGGMLAYRHAGRAATPNHPSHIMSLYDLRECGRPVRIASGPLPLSEGASLDWVGFSESGVLCTVDTAGIVRGCLRSYAFEWVPLLDCAAPKKAKNEHHWIVGLTDRELICVPCRGEEKFPPTLPRPTTPLPLSMPLTSVEPSDPAVERDRLRRSCSASIARRPPTRAPPTTRRAGAAAQGLHQARRADAQAPRRRVQGRAPARALDLATTLQLPRSLSAALKLANHYKRGPLADRITRLMEARFGDGGDEMEDVEEAPASHAGRLRARARAPPRRRRRSRPTAAADADADDEDGNDEDGGAAGNGADAAPVNPAKGANKEPTSRGRSASCR